MPLDGRFITFAGNGLDDRCGHHVGFSALRPDACIHLTEARPLRRCVARPSKESQQNERATYTAMDGGHLFHLCRPTARLPNALGERQRRADASQGSTRRCGEAVCLRAGPLGDRLAAFRSPTTGTDVSISTIRALPDLG